MKILEEVKPKHWFLLLGIVISVTSGGVAWVARAESEHTYTSEELKEIRAAVKTTADNQKNIEIILERQITLEEEREKRRQEDRRNAVASGSSN